MRAAVEDGAAVGTHEVRVARGFAPGLLRAETTVDRRTEPLLTAPLLDDPRREAERRLVPHMPLVATGELRDPVAPVVLVEADDLALHPDSVRSRCSVSRR